jgi:hypothetical protein
LWDFLSNLGRSLFEWLGQALASLFGPLIDLIDGLVYFLASALDVIVKAVAVLLYLVQLLVSFGGGLVNSFVNLATFNPASIPAETNHYAPGTSLLFSTFSDLGGDVVAAVLSWGLWFLLAGSVVWLFNGRRG